MNRTVAVVSAGLTTPSSTRLLADQLTAAVRDNLDGRGTQYEVKVFELRELAQDITNNLLTGFPSKELGEVLEYVVRADALIAVTPTFSASYNGLFKMFFDVIDDKALVGKPVLIGATGRDRAAFARAGLRLAAAFRLSTSGCGSYRRLCGIVRLGTACGCSARPGRARGVWNWSMLSATIAPSRWILTPTLSPSRTC